MEIIIVPPNFDPKRYKDLDEFVNMTGEVTDLSNIWNGLFTIDNATQSVIVNRLKVCEKDLLEMRRHEFFNDCKYFIFAPNDSIFIERILKITVADFHNWYDDMKNFVMVNSLNYKIINKIWQMKDIKPPVRYEAMEMIDKAPLYINHLCGQYESLNNFKNTIICSTLFFEPNETRINIMVTPDGKSNVSYPNFIKDVFLAYSKGCTSVTGYNKKGAEQCMIVGCAIISDGNINIEVRYSKNKNLQDYENGPPVFMKLMGRVDTTVDREQRNVRKLGRPYKPKFRVKREISNENKRS
jgi:hypothetical protein